MDAKEKAAYLVETFRNYLPLTEAQLNNRIEYDLALMCAEEVLMVVKANARHLSTVIYWEQVKQELEKL